MHYSGVHEFVEPEVSVDLHDKPISVLGIRFEITMSNIGMGLEMSCAVYWYHRYYVKCLVTMYIYIYIYMLYVLCNNIFRLFTLLKQQIALAPSQHRDGSWYQMEKNIVPDTTIDGNMGNTKSTLQPENKRYTN